MDAFNFFLVTFRRMIVCLVFVHAQLPSLIVCAPQVADGHGENGHKVSHFVQAWILVFSDYGSWNMQVGTSLQWGKHQASITSCLIRVSVKSFVGFLHSRSREMALTERVHCQLFEPGMGK